MKKRSGSKMVGVGDGEKEPGDGKVGKDKARQDPAVALLSKRVEELERQLETERKLNHLEIDEVKAKNHEDLMELERQLEESVKKREEMNERLDRVETMEKSIANLYLEVHDRTSTDKRTQEEIEEERMQLRKKNPLVVLDQLRAHLRALLAFRDDYENELKSHVQKKRTETEESLFKAKEELEERRMEVSELQRALKKSESTRDAIQKKRDEFASSSEKMIGEMRRDNQMMVHVLRQKEKEIDELHKMLDKKDEILRHKEMKMMRVTQLESDIVKHRTQHQFDLNRMRAQGIKARQSYEKEIAMAGKVDTEKRQLMRELEEARSQVRAFKADINRSRVLELQKKLERVEGAMLKKDAELKEANEEARRLAAARDDLARKNLRIKHEYDRLFAAAERESHLRKDDEKKARDSLRTQSDDVDKETREFYEKKLKEKDRELAEMSRRVKRLLLAERTVRVRDQKRMERQVRSSLGHTMPAPSRGGTSEDAGRRRWSHGLTPSARRARRSLGGSRSTFEDDGDDYEDDRDDVFGGSESGRGMSPRTGFGYEHSPRSLDHGDIESLSPGSRRSHHIEGEKEYE
eukprot:TRINITY_DN80221_c0_g1_i1.p1 TRINITY_DN80221_c0_g1~~TRINITY_DN80221_c0_g1_i1.p1  ORF type:complete len:579 (-),score=213.54 TRINITY_DN80221_c0_g1_i1:144-1880(-)